LLLTIPASATFPGENGRIAFVANPGPTYQLYTINPDGSDMQQITNLPPTQNATWFPAYSPDGKRILFSHDMTGALELYVINADGTGLLQLTSDGAGSLFAHWSPDGTHIVYTRGAPNGSTVIVTMRSDGTQRQVLTANIPYESYQPEYTPDGNQIVFASQAGGLISAIWIMNTDGSNQRRLTAAPLEAGGPDSSPDGSKITFYSHQNTQLPANIFVMNLDGSGLTGPLSAPGHLTLWPIYSPDGKKIVFQSDQLSPGAMDLFTMNADGTGKKRIATNLIFGGCFIGNCLTPDWGPRPAEDLNPVPSNRDHQTASSLSQIDAADSVLPNSPCTNCLIQRCLVSANKLTGYCLEGARGGICHTSFDPTHCLAGQPVKKLVQKQCGFSTYSVDDMRTCS